MHTALLDHPFAPAKTERQESCLRILHITPSVAPSVGGPATVITHLAAAQASLGQKVTMLANVAPAERAAYLDSTRNIPHFNSVETIIHPWTSVRSRWFGGRLLPIYKTLLAKADIVHIHGVWEPMLLLAASAAQRRGIPYVIRPCGMLDPWSLRRRPLKKRLAMMLAHKRMLDRAAFVHTLSPSEAELLDPLHIKTPRRIIPNGVCLDEVDFTLRGDLFSRVPALEGHPYILFLGRLHEKKGLDYLAQAFIRIAARLPFVHLLVAGPDGGAKAPFLEAMRGHGLTSRVHLPGTLVGPAKFAALQNAACFCLPSRQEGFSNAVVEALAARLPVAISTECHFPEVQQMGAGLVFPLAIDAITDTLHQLLTLSPSQREKMGNAARRFVEKSLTWQQVAGKTIQAYHASVGAEFRPYPRLAVG